MSSTLAMFLWFVSGVVGTSIVSLINKNTEGVEHAVWLVLLGPITLIAALARSVELAVNTHSRGTDL